MNLIITAFEGQLADDPDYQETKNHTPVATGVVLINRKVKTDAGYADAEPTRRRIKAWRANAKRLAQLEKGSTVVVIGATQTESWNDTDTGDKRTSEVVIVESIGKGLLLARSDHSEHINAVRDTGTE